MTIKETIQKAIDQKYEGEVWSLTKSTRYEVLTVEGDDVYFGSMRTTVHKLFLDPLFWQALGKALGWYENEEMTRNKHYCPDCQEWLYHWHRFIDHLADGKSAEEFFKTLAD